MRRVVSVLLFAICVCMPTSGAPAAPQVVTKVKEFALASINGRPFRPRISGDWVVVVRNSEKRAENVMLINVPTNKAYTLYTIADGTSIFPCIDNNLVVWPGKTDDIDSLRGAYGSRGQLSRSMIIYDLNSWRYSSPEINTVSAFYTSISGKLIAYELGSRIYLYDLARRTQSRISDNSPWHSTPQIRGDLVVWSAKPNNSANRQVYCYQISKGSQTAITTDDVDHISATTDGRYIAWWTKTGVDVYDTADRSTFTIPKGYFPALDAGLLAFQRQSSPGINPIYGMNLATHQEFAISSGSANVGPDIQGGRVIWCNNNTVYCAELSTMTKAK